MQQRVSASTHESFDTPSSRQHENFAALTQQERKCCVQSTSKMASSSMLLRRALQRPVAVAAASATTTPWRRWLPKAHAIVAPCSQRAVLCRYSSNSAAATTQAGDAAAFDRVVAARFSCHSYDSSKDIPSDVLQRVIDHTLVWFTPLLVDSAAFTHQALTHVVSAKTTTPNSVPLLASMHSLIAASLSMMPTSRPGLPTPC